MIRVPQNRVASQPGEMLNEEFIVPMGLNQQTLADAIQVPVERINEIISGKRRLSTSTALRLSKFFNMSPGYSLNLQKTCDLQQAELKESEVLKSIRPLKTPLVR